MTWTDEDKAFLRAFKDNVDSDDIRVKEKIKQILLSNRYIIHVINDKELEDEVDDEGTGIDEYFGTHILPYYIINPAQSASNTFICYEVCYDELDRYNSTVKKLSIIFYILCEHKTLKDVETGIPRHDLLAALIQDQFNYTNHFGSTIKLVSDVPSVVDRSYACRTLTFEQTTDNNVVKTKNGIPMMVSHGGR